MSALAMVIGSLSYSSVQSIGRAAVPALSKLAEPTEVDPRLSRYQLVCPAAVIQSDVGVLALSIAPVVCLLYPSRAKPALSGGIDWSTILLVGGVLTYVGVLERSTPRRVRRASPMPRRSSGPG